MTWNLNRWTATTKDTSEDAYVSREGLIAVVDGAAPLGDCPTDPQDVANFAKQLAHNFDQSRPQPSAASVRNCVELALLKTIKENGTKGAYATASGVVWDGDDALVFAIGDASVYLVNGGRISNYHSSGFNSVNQKLMDATTSRLMQGDSIEEAYRALEVDLLLEQETRGGDSAGMLSDKADEAEGAAGELMVCRVNLAEVRCMAAFTYGALSLANEFDLLSVSELILRTCLGEMGATIERWKERTQNDLDRRLFVRMLVRDDATGVGAERAY